MLPKIVAIVISFNRLQMVQRCVESLRAQTRKLDAILVVDSSTKTEVREWLEAQPDVTLFHLDNIGPAGSMHCGMKRAFAENFDWQWLFDDDVAVMPDALERLLDGVAKRNLRILNCYSTRDADAARPSVGAILWRKDPNDILFGEKLLTTEQVYAHADASGFIDTVGGLLYQGTLIAREVVAQTGLPRIEYYNRGHEVEHGLRLMRAGYHLYLYLPSRAIHPSSGTEYIKFFGKLYPTQITPPAKRYFNIRNGIWIRREYYRGYPYLPYVARRMLAALTMGVFVQPNQSLGERIKAGRIILRAVRDGLQPIQAVRGEGTAGFVESVVS